MVHQPPSSRRVVLVGTALAALACGLAAGLIIARLRAPPRKQPLPPARQAGIVRNRLAPAVLLTAPAPQGKPLSNPDQNTPSAKSNATPPACSPRDDHADTERPAEPPAGSPSAGHLFQNLSPEAWKTRVDLARNTLIATTGLSDEQVKRLDEALQEMNVRLSNHVGVAVSQIRTREDVGPETGVRLLHLLSGDVVQTYDTLDRFMPAGWRTNAGGSFTLVNFINPDVVRPLADVEAALATQEAEPVHGDTEADP